MALVSQSDNDSSGSASLNELDRMFEAENDLQGISLLRQIFPEESTEELRRLHRERLSAKKNRHGSPGNGTAMIAGSCSRLGKRIQRQHADLPLVPQECALPDDFLRLPPSVAVRRYDEDTDRWHYELVRELADRAALQHLRCCPNGGDEGEEVECEDYTKVVFRDARVGLGMTLYEERGIVRVHSLTSRDGRQWHSTPPAPSSGNDKDSDADAGPALKAGVVPGDILLGINGSALSECVSPDEGLLKYAVSAISRSPDPIVLHLRRTASFGNQAYSPPPVSFLRFGETTPSLLDTSDVVHDSPSTAGVSSWDSSDRSSSFRSTPSTPRRDGVSERSDAPVHPFVSALAARGLVRSAEEQISASRMLDQLTERTRLWEEGPSFRINSPPCPRGAMGAMGNNAFVPMVGVRKALCVRVVNTFTDGNHTAYTIWAFDVEAGTEWYAPVRYFRDFQDLRAATLPLCRTVASLPFPKQPMSLLSFGGVAGRAETPAEREAKCRHLERFLRSLCAVVYRERLHPGVAEVAVHVQSFLGCDTALLGRAESGNFQSPLSAGPSWSSSPFGDRSVPDPVARQAHVRGLLKRGIQMYTYRLFLLDAVCAMVDNFVDSVRARGPSLQDIEALEAQGRSVLKERAMEDLGRIQSFLDQVQELVLDGCMNDFRSIAEREDYALLREVLQGNKRGGGGGSAHWERLVREAVREQIEIEVYVPLRGVVSRWLVNGWRHEDMEVHFKIKELRKRPQRFFRIPDDKTSPSNWASVSAILKEGVGLSTLPCAKLRAIVDAAREISVLFYSERRRRTGHDDDGEDSDSEGDLGADDFLPIFIFAVVQAEMERPCALCVLLHTVCDRINRIGEIGYYFASFEAAITHIQEIDLMDGREGTGMVSIALGD